MQEFDLALQWYATDAGAPEERLTMAMLRIKAGETLLTENEDIWSKTVRPDAFLSMYPLAIWFASNWWRLLNEPAPAGRTDVDWRMAHELAAAGRGYLWPVVRFSSDGEVIHVSARPYNGGENQSIRYLNGLEKPALVPIEQFESALANFISLTAERLSAIGIENELGDIWNTVSEERLDRDISAYRKLEARLGFDAGDGSEALVKHLLQLQRSMGESALSELAIALKKSEPENVVTEIESILEFPSVPGKLEIPNLESRKSRALPWERALSDARQLRTRLGNQDAPFSDRALCDLLGVQVNQMFETASQARASVAIPTEAHGLRFIPRKNHPLAKRFELARFVGDSLYARATQSDWLTNTDSRTARQQYQRAFAAEFLCPASSLFEFLNGDYSETGEERAKDHFGVSLETIGAIIENNEEFQDAWTKREISVW